MVLKTDLIRCNVVFVRSFDLAIARSILPSVFLRSVEGDEPLIRGETHPSSEPTANYCEFESSQGTPNDSLSR
jgi:hypothetical protein